VVINTGSGSVIVQFPVQHPAGAPASAASSAPAESTVAPATSGALDVPVTSGPGVQGVD
jgi:hypothetical protein